MNIALVDAVRPAAGEDHFEQHGLQGIRLYQRQPIGGPTLANYGTNPRKLAVTYDAQRQQVNNVLVQRTDNTDTIINTSYDYANGGGNNGRIQKITDYADHAYDITYGYDAFNRLTSASATAYTRSYSYDVWGNLTSVSGSGGEWPNYTFNYQRDGNGAPTSNQILNLNGVASYSYDAANRLKNANLGN